MTKDMTDTIVIGFEEYRQEIKIRAIKMKQKFKVASPFSTNGYAYGNIGDYLCENKDGVRFVMTNEDFIRNMELIKEPNEYEVKTWKNINSE